MPSFTTRVELHDASYVDYTTLHAEMAKQGFSRTIKGDSGKVFHLPTAEYDFSGSISRADVCERARSAAAVTGRKCSVLVTESAGRTWKGLVEK